MNSLETIRNKMKLLYETDPHVRVNISLTHPKLSLKNDPVIIKGVYPHIFQIEERSSGVPKCHSLQYSDILTRHIEILEFD